MEFNINQVLLPCDIYDLIKNATKLSYSTEKNLNDMIHKLKLDMLQIGDNKPQLKQYLRKLKIINNVLLIYKSKIKIYNKNFQSDFEILTEFNRNYYNCGENYTKKSMYLKLCAEIYNRIRKNIDQCCIFLHEIEDPIIYVTNVKKKEKQLLQQKITTENMNYTLGDGSKLPPMQIDDNELRRRIPNR